MILVVGLKTACGEQKQESDHPEIQNGASIISPAAADNEEEKTRGAEAPEIRRLGNGKHRSSDKSVAAGGVIIGGLITAIFAAVFCYIRVTKKTKDAHTTLLHL
ncbi:hypothetical protein M5689_018784 [Euphorbia peplus]|nr:hypothetical protein M5689_018784 [Euphorbia peplus]